MKKPLAFVLGGGGSRGAMQVGALRAILEAGFNPEILAGTSVGAVNATFLAVHGFHEEGLNRLEAAWMNASHQDLLPTHIWWQLMRIAFRRAQGGLSYQRFRDFAVEMGISPELKFRDIHQVSLRLIAADINAGCPVVFGNDPDQLVLDSTIASMTLPPWLLPMNQEGRYLVDGGLVSNLPIEAALSCEAGEIIALDISSIGDDGSPRRGLSPFIVKLDKTIENRQLRLEMELAEAKGVPVHLASLVPDRPVQLWDFRYSEELIERGYQITRAQVETW